MEKVIKIGSREYFLYGSYSSVDKALMIANAYKEDKYKYTIRKSTTPILVSDVFNLYLSGVSPLNNGVLILG